MGRPTLFSDLIDLDAYSEEHAEIVNVAMAAGERLRGRLSDNVARPVSKGQVGLGLALTFDQQPSWETCIFWRDYALINPDGTFEFSSVPRGADLQLTAINEDWVSVSAQPAEILERFPNVNTPEHAQGLHDTMVIGESVGQDAPRPVVVIMERTAKCSLTVVDDQGQPVQGATVYMSPNVSWFPGLGGIVGLFHRTVDGLGKTADELKASFMAKAKLTAADPGDMIGRYRAVTDKTGKATIHALPGKRGQNANVEHEQFELPTPKDLPFHRTVYVDLWPGETTAVHLTVQAKGVEGARPMIASTNIAWENRRNSPDCLIGNVPTAFVWRIARRHSVFRRLCPRWSWIPRPRSVRARAQNRARRNRLRRRTPADDPTGS